MQKGQLIKRHGAWHLRYWRDGKRVCQRLAPFNDTFRTERSVRPLVDEILGPLNEGRQPGGPQTLQNFIERTYLPYAKEHKRPSTYKGYYNLYRCYISARVPGVKLWQFRLWTRNGYSTQLPRTFRFLTAVCSISRLSSPPCLPRRKGWACWTELIPFKVSASPRASPANPLTLTAHRKLTN